MIEVKNVTKKYGNFVAVDNISFEVKDHEIVGFLGPNGAGKSTTMNMITGFIEPTDGKIVVNGYDISSSPLKAKKQIGYMPESVPLYSDLTVKEFLYYMADLKRVKRKDRKEAVNKVMEETGLVEVKNRLTKNISRGFKQRVSLAGALIGNPDILILDEPTVGLDPKQIKDIRALIKKFGKDHTVILSSHILSEVSQICERVIIINGGKIVAIDTPENLEEETRGDNSIVVIVEDPDDKMKTLKIKDAKEIKFIAENNDGTKQYMIVSEKDKDIRKKIFSELAKAGVTIFELKQIENTLEDAFLKIVNKKQEENKKETEKKEKKSNKNTNKEVEKKQTDIKDSASSKVKKEPAKNTIKNSVKKTTQNTAKKATTSANTKVTKATKGTKTETKLDTKSKKNTTTKKGGKK